MELHFPGNLRNELNSSKVSFNYLIKCITIELDRTYKYGRAIGVMPFQIDPYFCCSQATQM